jgi:hypothetical protein
LVDREITDVEPSSFLDLHTKQQLLHIKLRLATLSFGGFGALDVDYGPAFVVILRVGVDHFELLFVLTQNQIALALLQDVFSAVFSEGDGLVLQQEAEVFDEFEL